MQIRLPVHRPFLGAEELEAVRQIFDSRWLGLGANTKAFEQKLAGLLGVRHVIATNTGSAALHMALLALDLEPEDEVVVPSLTFPSSVQVILAVQAKPVFCEVREDTLTMDMEDAFRRVTERTRVMLPVHYGGRVCDMETLAQRADDRDILVVEDAAHAFGSTSNGRAAGTMGDIGCFSFDPVKNITCGGGGAVATDQDEIAARIRRASNIGLETDSWSRLDQDRHWFYKIVTPGFRYHMGNINAAIGLEQLKRMEAFLSRKREIVRRYDGAFAGLPGVLLLDRDLEHTFPFNYVIRVLDGRREALMTRLREEGIGFTVQFIPVHLQPLFARTSASLPVTERLYQEILTLPLYFEMSDSDVGAVISAVRRFFGGR